MSAISRFGAGERLARRHRRVGAGVPDDLVGIRGAHAVDRAAPVRVANQRQVAAGGVALDHVRAGEHLRGGVAVPRRRAALVRLDQRRVVGGHRRGSRQRQRLDHGAGERLGQVEDDGRVVRRADSGDRLVTRHGLRSNDREVARRVAVLATLALYMRSNANATSLEVIVAVDRRAELPVRLDVHRERLAIRADDGRPGGQQRAPASSGSSA